MGRERPDGRFSVCTDPIVALTILGNTGWCWQDEIVLKARRICDLNVQEWNSPRVWQDTINKRGAMLSDSLAILLRSYDSPVKPSVSSIRWQSPKIGALTY